MNEPLIILLAVLGGAICLVLCVLAWRAWKRARRGADSIEIDQADTAAAEDGVVEEAGLNGAEANTSVTHQPVVAPEQARGMGWMKASDLASREVPPA